MKQFDMDKLTVWHRLRDVTGAGMRSEQRDELKSHAFFVATCMREFAVANHANVPRVNTDGSTCQLRSQDAYVFLLRTMTGLNSSVAGETNVQGQIRKAWDAWRRHASPVDLAAMNPLMHNLFADSRTIRRHYLEGIGGTSYGSLVRKLLRADSHAKILFVGAGELARSITPYFSNHATAVWNRHATDAVALGVRLAFAPGEDQAAAAWATHVVITTPPDSQNDAHWNNLLSNQAKLIRVAHLGLRRAQRGVWRGYSRCSDLDDLIELRQSQSSMRVARLERAHQACDRTAYSYAPISDAGLAARAA